MPNIPVNTKIVCVNNVITRCYSLAYAAGANGSITGVVSQTILDGNSGSEVTATPNSGYKFVSWSDGITTAARTDINVRADKNVTATFALI